MNNNQIPTETWYRWGVGRCLHLHPEIFAGVSDNKRLLVFQKRERRLHRNEQPFSEKGMFVPEKRESRLSLKGCSFFTKHK
ncbi:MAG: hypothetical protein IKY64_04460 [Bacteroidaceae bacterium]|nr:hypothetical protein [Bacteroidaceae bacterium]